MTCKLYTTDVVPFGRPLAESELCAWCYDARVCGGRIGEGPTRVRTWPCPFCGEFVDDFDGKLYGEPGLRYGNPYLNTFGAYVRWREYMAQLREVDLRRAVMTEPQQIAERALRQRFPRAATFYDRFVKERGFPDRPYPDPVRFWIVTNPDFSPRRLAAQRKEENA